MPKLNADTEKRFDEEFGNFESLAKGNVIARMKQFLAEELHRQNQEWIEFVEGLIDSIHQERHHFSDYYEDMNSLETMGEVADKLKDKLKKRGKEHHDE